MTKSEAIARAKVFRDYIESVFRMFGEEVNPDLVARLFGAFLESDLARPEVREAYGKLYAETPDWIRGA